MFTSQYPRVKVRVLAADNMSQEFWQVRDRQVDLLLGRVTKLFAEEDLEAEVLYDDRAFIVSGSNNRWASRRKVQLEELLGDPWLLPGEGFFLAEAFRSQSFGRSEVRRDIIFRVSAHRFAHHRSFYWSAVWLRDGFSPAVDSSLSVLPVAFSADTWPVAIVKLKGRTISPVVQTFIDCIRDVAKPLKEGR